MSEYDIKRKKTEWDREEVYRNRDEETTSKMG